MKLELSYVFHNSFLVRTPEKLLLFDYPQAEFLQSGERAYVEAAVDGADLLVCVSHSHKDHFTPAIEELARHAARVRYVLSYDVAELYPDFDPEESGRNDVTVIEPDAWAEVDGIRILGLESTDLGVGFLLQLADKTIYFGGDVAEWDWPQADERSRAFSREHFARTLETLASFDIDLAFSNADSRLENWSGAKRLVETLKPRFFVPMHTFGRLESLQQFCRELKLPPTVEMLSYDRLGVFARIDL